MRFLLLLFTSVLWAQDGAKLHNLEIGGGGIFPVAGYIANNSHSGPAGMASYELRLLKPLGAEIGYLEGSVPGAVCSRFGCEYPRAALSLLNYGLRGHLCWRDCRLDVSLGVGGAYVWNESYQGYADGTLFQYSAKVSVALDHSKHFRLAGTVRTYRDLGSPTQQWITTTGSFIFAFGKRF